MCDDQPHVSPQSPYRQPCPPPPAEASRDVSVAFVACFVVFFIVLVKALSVDPSASEGIGKLSVWQPPPSHPLEHRR